MLTNYKKKPYQYNFDRSEKKLPMLLFLVFIGNTFIDRRVVCERKICFFYLIKKAIFY